MLQISCKTLGFKKSMVDKIPAGGGGEVNHIQPVSYIHLQGEFIIFVELWGLSHIFEDGFNIIFQYNSPLLQCV